MKKIAGVLILASFSCFAQEASQLNKMNDEVALARIICPGKGSAEATKSCTEESVGKIAGMYGELKKQFAKNPAAMTSLKNYYAAAVAALKTTGTQNDRRLEDQTTLRLAELMMHLKIESGM